MLILWLRLALVWCLKLIIPPPQEPVIPKIDPNAPCPSCGNRQGSIVAVDVNGQKLVRHNCTICKARWHESPVLQVKNVISTPEEPQR